MNPDSNDELNFRSQQHQINVLSASPEQPSLRLPYGGFLGDRDNYNTLCVPLYQASNNGHWPAAKEIIQRYPELVRCSITENYETILHIAVSTKYTKHGVEFVKNLVNIMACDDLELQNRNGETALFLAAVAGHVPIVKILANKNPGLLTIPDSEGKMPVSVAALYRKCEMAEYLYTRSSMIHELWTYKNLDYLLMKCIEADLFDIALDIVGKRPEHATSGNALRILARKPEAFKRKRTRSEIFTSILGLKDKPNEATPALQLLRTIWQSVLKLDKKQIDDIIRGPQDDYYWNPTQIDEESSTPEFGRKHYPSDMLFVAAEKGNKTFVVELIRQYPDLIRKVNDEGQSIFHVAVLHRQKGIFSLLDEIGSIKNSVITLVDIMGNNMLHLTGKRVIDEREKDDKRNDNVSGLVLRMQQELQWFEAVKAILPPFFQEKMNSDGLTPGEVFTRGHSRLLSVSAKWLKDLASQLMVVAALIAAIAFAAPFTVPGGWNQETGSPLFMHKRLFMVFIILDAISFILSSVSILVLISILTSRYTERDFLEDLPKKMVVCLATLMYALLTVLLTFLINLFIFNQNKSIGIFMGVFLVIVSPFFTSLQDPLFLDMRQTMNGHRSFFS